jgi:cyclophilin family peptidyl-prolyl cis-trans isomerase
VGITLVVIAVVVAAGVVVGRTVQPQPSGDLASCHTATQLAPDLYGAAPPRCIDPNKKYVADINTSKGHIKLTLLAKQMPDTVNNFVVLAVNGYYDGQAFFGAKDWLVEAGDPTGTGSQGPGYALAPKPNAQGEQWQPGSLGMARLPDGNLSGSQFFITRTSWQGGNPNVNYNHFATVTDGFDTATQLGGSDRILRIAVTEA